MNKKNKTLAIMITLFIILFTFTPLLLKFALAGKLPSNQLNQPDLSSGPDNISSSESNPSSQDTVPTEQKVITPVVVNKPAEMRATTITVGVDILKSNLTENQLKQEYPALIKKLMNYKLNTLIIDSRYKGKAIYNSKNFDKADIKAETEGFDPLKYMVTTAKDMGFFVYISHDIFQSNNDDKGKEIFFNPAKPADIDIIVSECNNLAVSYNADGLELKGCVMPSNITDEIVKIHYNDSKGMSLDDYQRSVITNSMMIVSKAIKSANPGIHLGYQADSVWANKATNAKGSQTNASQQSFYNHKADTLGWLAVKEFDFITVNNLCSVLDAAVNFDKVTAYWSAEAAKHSKDLYINHAAYKVGTNESGWQKPDQIIEQVRNSKKNKQVKGNIFLSAKDIIANKLGFADALVKYYDGNISDEFIGRELLVTNPKSSNITVEESRIILSGTSDPNYPLLLNGKPVSRTETGLFSSELELKLGDNKFTLSHKGKVLSYNIRRNTLLVKKVSPVEQIEADGKETIPIEVIAYKNSAVTAEFNKKTYTLKPAPTPDNQAGDAGGTNDYESYVANISLPAATDKVQNLGNIVFTVTNSGLKEVKKGASVKIRALPPPVKPPSGGKIEGTVVEVASEFAETFDYNTIDDWSKPYLYFLPKGTKDILVGESSYYDQTNKKYFYYYKLRSGKRVYKDDCKITGEKSIDENTIKSVKEIIRDNYSDIVFEMTSKVPFVCNLQPVSFRNDGSGDYTVSAFNAEYLDIIFDYTISAAGLPEFDENSLFKSAEWLKTNDNKPYLRLMLRQKGGFYGFETKYDESGNLIFSFINRKIIYETNNNPYGYRLDGIKILIDPGHGGNDPGALGSIPSKTEKIINLELAKLLQAELESIGATVIMTRTTDVNILGPERLRYLNDFNGDLVISVHHNSAATAKAYGPQAYYFFPFSQPLADNIEERLYAVYKNYMVPNYLEEDRQLLARGDRYYPFFVTRCHQAPSVLLEYGFMSNKSELRELIKPETQARLAKATVLGIIDYFKATSAIKPYQQSGSTSSGGSSSSQPPASSEIPAGSSSDSGSSALPPSQVSQISFGNNNNRPSRKGGLYI